MSSQHVFIETNWVVGLVAPAISRNPGANELVERSRCGELVLHVPAIALSEAHKVIRERTTRVGVDNIRAFVRDARDAGGFDAATADVAFSVLTRFEQQVAKERREAPERIAALPHNPAVDVFALDEHMLARSIELAAESGLALQSFDMAILAAVLVRGEALYAEGNTVAFCTLDADLQPWDRIGKRRERLADLFDAAGVWVYGDFTLESPVRPQRWPLPPVR